MFYKLFSPALILSVGTLLSYILGILRDLLFARYFGANVITDTYSAAFLISDVIMVIFVSSALLGLVTPLFLQERENNTKAGYTLFGVFFASILLIFSAVSLVGIFFTPEILSFFFSVQFSKEPELFTNLARLFFITNFFFAISNFIGSFLMVHKHFFSTALSPLLYNVGIVLGIIFFAESCGIYAPVYGAIAGSIGYLGVRLWEYFSKISLDKRFYPSFNWKSPMLKELGASMAFRWVTVGTLQIMLITVQNFSQSFENQDGLYTLFLYARNLESAPVMIFGFAIATSAFQVLSQLFAEKKKEEMSKTFFIALYKILFWTIPMAVGIYFIGSMFLGMAYGLDITSNIYKTLESILLIIALAIPFESVLTLFVRTFNATGDTKIPMIITFTQIGTLIFTVLLFKYVYSDMFLPATQIGIIYLASFVVSVTVGYMLLLKKNIIKYSVSYEILQKIGFQLSLIASGFMAFYLYVMIHIIGIHLDSFLAITIFIHATSSSKLNGLET